MSGSDAKEGSGSGKALAGEASVSFRPGEDGGNVISRMLTRARSSKNILKPTKATYHRIIVDGDDGDSDYEKCCELIATCILIRARYKDIDKGQEELRLVEDGDPPPGPTTELRMVDGVFCFGGQKTFPVEWKKYITDVKKIFSAIEDGPCLSTARSRLTILEEEFELYSLLNTRLEEDADPMRKGGGVFAHNTKVDNNVRLQTAVNAQQLVEYIIRTCSREQRSTLAGSGPNGEPVTLGDILKAASIPDVKEITAEGLGLHPPMRKRFHRFDAMDPKLNIGGDGSAELLQVFLKHNTINKGKYFVDLIKPLMKTNEMRQGRVLATEYKLPLNGTSAEEWYVLARWLTDNGLLAFSRNSWVLQITRQKEIRGSYQCANVEDQLRHIFEPMFRATLDPEDHSEGLADIAAVLKHVGAFNIVSDETLRAYNFHTEPRHPASFPWDEVPDDFYFYYYVWANICSLNALRARMGLNTFQFRPTAGEPSQQFDQLVSAYLLADSINNGLRLANSWILQYLYMFTKVGVVMSPLANNALSVPYFENPFPSFFKRGLNVALATDDPLHVHHSNEPLVEEYGTAKTVNRLTATDMSELALNSVLLSNFPHEIKAQWLGPQYALGVDGNDIRKSSVCDFRLQFRSACLYHEQNVLNLMLAHTNKPITVTIVHQRRHDLHSGGLIRAVDQLRDMRRINYMDRRIKYPRIDIFGGMEKDVAYENVVAPLRDVLKLREKYQKGAIEIEERSKDVTVEDVFRKDSEAGFQEDYWEFNNFYGVYVLYPVGRIPSWPSHIPTMREYVKDVSSVTEVVMSGEVIALAHHRLQLLEHKFGLHLAMNIGKESGKPEEKSWNNRDFFTAYKVDGNVELDAGMNARMMLHFFKDKALHNGHDVVEEKDNRPVTLHELLESLHIRNVTHLTVDELNYVMNSNELLKSLFCSTDNYMRGRYFAELTQLSFEQHKRDAYTFVENRLVVRGRDPKEWDDLSSWFDRYGMASKQNRWIINIPRKYSKLKREGFVSSFGEFIEHVFQPLWEVSLHPAQHSKFHYFLSHVSGFDTIDDETKVDLPLSDLLPHDWRDDLNPPYNYYLYYLWANISSLNAFRASRGLNTFKFRPQCGENGGVEHLVGGFLLADGINQGVQLTKFPALEYLFYISQIGITMSPLANTTKSCAYLENPFPKFFRRGLKVSLATSQPLHFHFTQEPLIEEYSIASKIWKLSYNDLCEIARNSVQISGFRDAFRTAALGKLHFLHSTLGNDVKKSRVSDIRVAYRFEIYHTELNFLDELLSDVEMPRAVRLLEKEVDIYEKATGLTVEMPDELGEEEAVTPETLQKQIAEDQESIRRLNIALKSLEASRQQLTREIQRVYRSSREPVTLSANVAQAHGAQPQH